MVETIFNVLKISVIIVIATVFALAINALITLIITVAFSNVIGEILALVSMFLPFNGLVVFGAIGTVTTAVLTFLIAKKIFDLTSWSVSSI